LKVAVIASNKHPRAMQGFTLIEVLVALAIVAIGLAAGFRAAGTVGQGAQRLEDLTLAQWCAENQLLQMRLRREYPGFGETTFSCVQLNRTLQGQIQVRATPNPNFRRVDVRLLDSQGQPMVSLATVLGR